MARTLRDARSKAARNVSIDPTQLRHDIVEEAWLRREIAEEEERKRDRPEFWRESERARIEWNRERIELNISLTSLGLEPQPLLLSLAQRRQRLKRLQASIEVAVAALRRAGRGTPVASRKSR